MHQARLLALCVTLVALTGCKGSQQAVVTRTVGAAVPDTIALLAQAAADQPGDTFHVIKLATYTFGNEDPAVPYHIAVVELNAGNAVRAVAYVGDDAAGMKKFFDTGYIHPAECGGVEISVPEVRPFALARRPLIEVIERRYYPGCMEDDVQADTLTAHFYDARGNFREVLHFEERMTENGGGGDHTPARRVIHTAYYNADACFGLQGCHYINMSRLTADSAVGVGLWHLYQWNADTTAIVAIR